MDEMTLQIWDDSTDITTAQWETIGGQELHFKVFIHPWWLPPKAPNCRCVLIGVDEPDRQRALSRVLELVRGPGQRLQEQVKNQMMRALVRNVCRDLDIEFRTFEGQP